MQAARAGTQELSSQRALEVLGGEFAIVADPRGVDLVHELEVVVRQLVERKEALRQQMSLQAWREAEHEMWCAKLPQQKRGEPAQQYARKCVSSIFEHAMSLVGGGAQRRAMRVKKAAERRRRQSEQEQDLLFMLLLVSEQEHTGTTTGGGEGEQQQQQQQRQWGLRFQWC